MENLSETKNNLENSAPKQKLCRTAESIKQVMITTEDEKKYRDNLFLSDSTKVYSTNYVCTKCNRSFHKLIRKGKKVSFHPLLNVLMCSSCCNFYGDGNLSLDSDGEDKYCRWCGEGGKLFLCSKCICAFCKECIKRNFNESALAKVENDDDWVCYFCDPKPLWYLRSICSFAQEESANRMSELEARKTRVLECSLSSYGSIRRRKKKLKLKKRRVNSESENSSSTDDINISVAEISRKDCIENSKNSVDNQNLSPSQSSKFDINEKKTNDALDSENIQEEDVILNKIKGFWKMTQIIAEISFNSSSEKLKDLSRCDFVKNITNLEKEFEVVKSHEIMLSSFITKASCSVDAIKNDLKCKNVKDEREFFQNKKDGLNCSPKKINGDYNIDCKNSKKKKFSSGTSKKKSKTKIKKLNSTSEDSNIEFEDISDLNKSSTSDTNLETNNTNNDLKAEVNKLITNEIKKPLLKVKSFAKMSNDNVFTASEKIISINYQNNNKVEEKNENDEYNVETEASSEEEVQLYNSKKKNKKLKNKKKRNSDSSDFSDRIYEISRSKKNKRQKLNLQRAFKQFRDKRKRFLNKVHNNNTHERSIESEREKKYSKNKTKHSGEESSNISENVKSDTSSNS